jgi:hypothetical protein
MFDTKIVNNQKYNQVVNIKPACTGLIQKSSPLSIITQCHLKSPLAETLLHPEGSHIKRQVWTEDYYDRTRGHWKDVKTPVTILQVMVFGDMECLIEYILTEELNKEE